MFFRYEYMPKTERSEMKRKQFCQTPHLNNYAQLAKIIFELRISQPMWVFILCENLDKLQKSRHFRTHTPTSRFFPTFAGHLSLHRDACYQYSIIKRETAR